MPSKRNIQIGLDPKPKREDFDRVLRALLDTPPVTREEIHRETSKRKKKVGKVIENGLTDHR